MLVRDPRSDFGMAFGAVILLALKIAFPTLYQIACDQDALVGDYFDNSSGST